MLVHFLSTLHIPSFCGNMYPCNTCIVSWGLSCFLPLNSDDDDSSRFYLILIGKIVDVFGEMLVSSYFYLRQTAVSLVTSSLMMIGRDRQVAVNIDKGMQTAHAESFMRSYGTSRDCLILLATNHQVKRSGD